MKIRIRSYERRFTLILPTRLLLSKGAVKLGLRIGKRCSISVPDIPLKIVDALCDEVKRIKKKHGSWELVDVQSADGEQINIRL